MRGIVSLLEVSAVSTRQLRTACCIWISWKKAVAAVFCLFVRLPGSAVRDRIQAGRTDLQWLPELEF